MKTTLLPLLMVHMVLSIVGCQAEANKSPGDGSAPQARRGNGTVELNDYALKDDGSGLVKLGTYHARVAPGSEQSAHLALAARELSDDTKALAARVGVTLAEINTAGQLTDLVSHKTLAEGCYAVAYDSTSQVFFADPQYPIEHFLVQVNAGLAILVSGKVCLDVDGSFLSFDSDGSLALSNAGIVNFVRLLMAAGASVTSAKPAVEHALALGGGGGSFWSRLFGNGGEQVDAPRNGVSGAPTRSTDILAPTREVPTVTRPLANGRVEVPAAGFAADSMMPLRSQFPAASAPRQVYATPAEVPQLQGLRTPHQGAVMVVPVAGPKALGTQALAASVGTGLRTGAQLPASDPRLRLVQDLALIPGDLRFDLPENQGFHGRLRNGTEFNIGGILGQGSFGTARLLTMKSRGGAEQTFAIKILRRGAPASRNPEQLAKAEATMGEFNGKPNFLTYYGKLTDQTGNIALVSEVAGKDLFYHYYENVHDGAKVVPDMLTEQRAMVDIAEGLREIHERGKVHWDIKLENFLLGRDGRVKYIDMDDVSPAPNGLAKASELPMRTQTPEYSSPERMYPLTGVEYSYKGTVDWRQSDVYAVGSVLLGLRHHRPPEAIFQEVMKKPWVREVRVVNGAQVTYCPTCVDVQNGSFYRALAVNPVYGIKPGDKLSKILVETLNPNPSLRPSAETLKAGLLEAFGRDPWATPGR